MKCKLIFIYFYCSPLVVVYCGVFKDPGIADLTAL